MKWQEMKWNNDLNIQDKTPTHLISSSFRVKQYSMQVHEKKHNWDGKVNKTQTKGLIFSKLVYKYWRPQSYCYYMQEFRETVSTCSSWDGSENKLLIPKTWSETL